MSLLEPSLFDDESPEVAPTFSSLKVERGRTDSARDLLLTQFDRLCDAPDAISCLRKFVRELALRGKLVEQDKNDERAVDSLKRLGANPSGDHPYQVPNSWAWVAIGEIADSRLGKMLDKAKNKGTEKRYLRNVNVRWFNFDLSDVAEMRLEDSDLKELALRSGDVLICEGGEPGRAAVWDEREQDIYFQKAIHRLRLPQSVSPQFFVHALREASDSGRLTHYFTGLTIKHLTGKGLASFIYPFPPLSEQHRIVAKVDELMALCDRLEEAQAERERRRERLNAASLARLNAPTVDPESFHTYAAFHLDHLSRLTICPEAVSQLRQTIMDLAVKGRLVPQNTSEGSAQQDLLRVASERLNLVKAGKLRREKPLAVVKADAVPFGIPTTWAWTRVGNASLFTEYGTSQQSHPSQDGVPVLKMGDIQGGKVVLGGQKKVPASIDDLPGLYLKKFDILYNRTNSPELVGKTGIFLGEDEAYTFASYLIRIRCSPSHSNPTYMNLAMNAPYFRQTQITPHLKQQCGQANVNGTVLKNMLVPLPPLAEQHRIVAEVDKLMALCDQFEQGFKTSASDSRRLFESVLQAALAD